MTKQNIHQFFWSHGNLIDYNYIVFNKRLLLSIKTTSRERETIIQKAMQCNSIFIAFLRKNLRGFARIGSITNLAGFYLQGFNNKFYQSRLTSSCLQAQPAITVYFSFARCLATAIFKPSSCFLVNSIRFYFLHFF